jgi:hypothetical protein
MILADAFVKNDNFIVICEFHVRVSHQYRAGQTPSLQPAKIQVEHLMDPFNSTRTLIAEALIGALAWLALPDL